MGDIADDHVNHLLDDQDHWEPDGEPIRCRSCGRKIYLDYNHNGKLAPFNYKDETPHQCPLNLNEFPTVS